MSFSGEGNNLEGENLNLCLIDVHLSSCLSNLIFYVYFSRNLSLFSVKDTG